MSENAVIRKTSEECEIGDLVEWPEATKSMEEAKKKYQSKPDCTFHADRFKILTESKKIEDCWCFRWVEGNLWQRTATLFDENPST